MQQPLHNGLGLSREAVQLEANTKSVRSAAVSRLHTKATCRSVQHDMQICSEY